MESRKRKASPIEETNPSKRQKAQVNLLSPDVKDKQNMTAWLALLTEKSTSLSFDDLFSLLRYLNRAIKGNEFTSKQVQELFITGGTIVCERLSDFIGTEGFDIQYLKSNEEEEGEINANHTFPWLLYNTGGLVSHGVVLNESFLKNIPALLTQLKNLECSLHEKSQGLHGISMIIVHSKLEMGSLKTELVNGFFEIPFMQQSDFTCVVRAVGNMSYFLKETFSTPLLENFIEKSFSQKTPVDNCTNYLMIEGIGKFAEKLDAPFDSKILNRLLSRLEQSSSNFNNLSRQKFMVTVRGLYYLYKANKINGNIESKHLTLLLAAFHGHYLNLIQIAALIRKYDDQQTVLKSINLKELSEKLGDSILRAKLSPIDGINLINALVLFKNHASLFKLAFKSAFSAIDTPFHLISSDIQDQLKNDLAQLTLYSEWGIELNNYIYPPQAPKPLENNFDTQIKPKLLARLKHGQRTYPTVNWNIHVLPYAERGKPGKQPWDIFQDYIHQVNSGKMSLYSYLLLSIQLSEDHYAGLTIKMDQEKICLMTFYNSLHHEEQDTALMTEIRENFFKAGLITTTVSISYEPKCKQQENKRKEECFILLTENFYCGIRDKWWPEGISVQQIAKKQTLCLNPNTAPSLWNSSVLPANLNSYVRPQPRM